MPTFDELVDSITAELSNADIVGLAGYYLREVTEIHPFSTGEIRDVIEPSLRHVPSDSLGAYPSYLQNRGHFQRRGEKWDLTADGLTYYSDLVTIPTLEETPRDEGDQFITASPPDDDFYQPLVADINKSYQYHVYDATMILTRKLLENLLIEILRIELDISEDIQSFYLPEHNRFQPFSVLIESFDDHLNRFRPYIPELDSTFINDLNSFRMRANANAHSIQVSITQSEIDARSDDADRLVRILFRLRQQVKLSADSDSSDV